MLRFLAEHKPDVLCLQETKCPDDAFPLKALRGSGYEHVMFAGQKGYNGVAILSRFPLHSRGVMGFCERQDARHISAVLGPEAGAASGIVLHDFYVPAGGDVPNATSIRNSPTSSTSWPSCVPGVGSASPVRPFWWGTSTSRPWSMTSGRTSNSSTW